MAFASLKMWLQGLFGGTSETVANVETYVDQLVQRQLVVPLPNDTNAATDLIYYFWDTHSGAKKVKAVSYLPLAAVDLSAHNGTNNAVISLFTNDGAGGANTTIANVSTSGSATNFVVGTPYDLSVQSASVTAGNVVGVKVDKNGAGLDVAAGDCVSITYEEA